MASTTELTARQKAAVIVRLLLDDEDQLPISELDAEVQALLAEEMAAMQLIDRSTRDAVITEFCEQLERIGLTFPGTLGATLELLGQQLSEDATDRLRRAAALSGRSDPWERVAALAVDRLVTLASSEAVEIAALMLSKLPVETSSEVFAGLPRERARAVALAMSMTGAVTQSALQRIGLVLLQAADSLPRPAIDSPATERVGAMLNFASSDLRDAILDGLDQDDADFAGGVRKTIFTFRHIPERIAPRDIPRITREVDNAVLVRALAGAKDNDAEAAIFILSNLPQRLAESLRGDMESAGAIRTRDAEAAMGEVVTAIRKLVDAGDLAFVPLPEDGETAA
ncbi:FliG C-terminal domain-containing protein [Paracoccus zhejiangensis]|uniref:Flagellar motor switch protein FliG n=1 Tax=Paracoccus zhejiangensis TaxID=1077935 RepID=A0A2H5EYI3_9RHOB|nr:FliG C-terminal domain-containing protein [Paracoccus zhejiangensis]AUH64334.1 flagellar motor switch protein FliG [Paracoccus zhejiangensis]